jgi:hypothetical protein
MRRVLLPLLAALFSTATFAQGTLPLCTLDSAAMPESWRAAGETAAALNQAPWSPADDAAVTHAMEVGIEEMIAHFAAHPAAVPDLWEDSIAAILEAKYASANSPELEARIAEGGYRNLDVLLEPFVGKAAAAMTCPDYEQVLPLALYASASGTRAQATAKLVELSNAAFAACGSLDGALGVTFPAVLADPAINDDVVFDLVIWSLLFIEAELVPGLAMPEEMRAFSPALWDFLRTYPIANASTYPEGAKDDGFIEAAYLATHIAYIPTGNHRFPIYVEDSPALYAFHRENFYPVMEMGELDLIAEFVDSLRQYGCTPENDLQVRDGTRYMLGLFAAAGGSWLRHLEEGETDPDDYDLIHKAWTAVLGIRPRNIEEPLPGTYGGIVRAWLPAP